MRLSWPERGKAIRRIFSAAVLATALSSILLHAAPPTAPPIVETNFFVLPTKATGSPGQMPRAADFRAVVGKEEYEVRSVTRASDWKDLKTVVVFDLAATAPESRACLIQQAKLVAPRLLQERNIEFSVVSSEWTEFHNHFSYGNGPAFEYFLPEPGAATDPCATLPAEKSKLSSYARKFVNPSSESAFDDLIVELKAQRGPVRVYWIGENFRWFDTEYVGGGWYEAHDFHPPNAAYGLVDEITRAGVSVSPVVWLNGKRGTPRGTVNQKADAEMARYLGGQSIVCDGSLGSCLESALASAAQGWIVQVAGPAVYRTDRYGLQSIELWYQPDRAVLDVKRPFLHGAEMPADNRAPSWNPTAALAVPLFDTEWLMGKAGCDAGPGSGGSTAAMTALLPTGALSDGADKLQTFVEFVDTDPAQSNAGATGAQARAAAIGQHVHLKVRQAAGRPFVNEKLPGKVEACVDLPSPTSAKGSYRVVVFNPKTGWAGVGVLPVAEVLSVQRGGATLGEK